MDLFVYLFIYHYSFTITMEFRALMPNGLMLYMADITTANPNFYFALYMRNGNLTLNLQSSTAASRAPASPTKEITSKYRYDNGIWNEVRQ